MYAIKFLDPTSSTLKNIYETIFLVKAFLTNSWFAGYLMLMMKKDGLHAMVALPVWKTTQ
jgi:hypothetical protein